MNPEQIQLVQRSAVALLGQADTWSTNFYGALFREHPDLRSMFPADMTAQRGKFVAEIAALLELIGNLDEFEDRASQLGADHVGYGVRAVHYRATSEALVTSISETLGRDATPPMLEAWRAVHDLVAESMMSGRHRAATS
ncbi:globin domain-containing protein [Aquihabitans sp. McL0605]|uniref:globin domain-containing protein n=1 Tax=Aquihabitans sp. McL0605 TaxID=3415671 RepID=UPI003CEE2A21